MVVQCSKRTARKCSFLFIDISGYIFRFLAPARKAVSLHCSSFSSSTHVCQHSLRCNMHGVAAIVIIVGDITRPRCTAQPLPYRTLCVFGISKVTSITLIHWNCSFETRHPLRRTDPQGEGMKPTSHHGKYAEKVRIDWAATVAL